MVEGAYHFGKGHDVHLNWYHLNNATHNNVGYQNIWNDTLQSTSLGTGSIHPEWDAANAAFGKLVVLDEKSQLRFHGGVQYARIHTSFDQYYPNGNLGNGNFTQQYRTLNSNYNGFGPRGGVDMNYLLGHGFSVYGNGAGALLIGTAGFNNQITQYTTATSTYVLADSATGTKTLMVPELEAKLGVKYDCYRMPALGRLPQGDLLLDVGWMWANYFNAQQFATSGLALGSESPNRGKLSRTDFAVQGLYFGLDWKGDF